MTTDRGATDPLGTASASRRGSRAALALLFVGWALAVGATTWGLFQARNWALRELESPEAAAAWNEWRAAAARKTEGVERRAPKSVEPPLLVMMRDHFPAVVAGAIVPLTFLYGFTVFVARRANGAKRERSTPRESLPRG